MDIVSYIIGHTKGKSDGEGTVVLDGTEYTFTDENNDGNIVIEESE